LHQRKDDVEHEDVGLLERAYKRARIPLNVERDALPLALGESDRALPCRDVGRVERDVVDVEGVGFVCARAGDPVRFTELIGL
jgi:hypothetical protein